MTDEQTNNNEDRSAQGLIKDLLVRVAELEGRLEILERGRKLNAARQAAFRQRKNETVTLRNVTDSNVTRHMYSKKDTKKVSKNNTKIHMPESFEPNIGWAMEDRGWDRERVELEANRFKSNCLAHNRKYSNWEQAWRQWCWSKYQQEGNGNGTNRQYPTRPPTSKERYGELLRSVRSNGLREFIAGVVSEPSSGRPGSVSHADSGRNGQIPVRASQTGNPASGDTDGSPDLFAQRGVRQYLVGPKIQRSSTGSDKANIVTDSYADD